MRTSKIYSRNKLATCHLQKHAQWFIFIVFHKLSVQYRLNIKTRQTKLKTTAKIKEEKRKEKDNLSSIKDSLRLQGRCLILEWASGFISPLSPEKVKGVAVHQDICALAEVLSPLESLTVPGPCGASTPLGSVSVSVEGFSFCLLNWYLELIKDRICSGNGEGGNELLSAAK